MPGHYKKIMLGHYKKTADQSAHTTVGICACIINWNNNTLENLFFVNGINKFDDGNFLVVAM